MIRFLVVVVMVALILAGCSSNEPKVDPVVDVDVSLEDLREFTLEELAKYDGKNGNPAYVAYEGYVYDVSGVSKWSSGSHGGYSAGTDITEGLNKIAPHGPKNINLAKKIGILK